MKPILFSIGSLHLYSFGVMVALGVWLSLWLMERECKREGGVPTAAQAQDLVFFGLVAGMLGARLYYVLQNAGDYAAHPLEFFAFWEGGLIFYGGVIGALAAIWIYLRLRKINFWVGLDFLVPYAALGHAFGRIGCFLTGCCYGKPCDLPWAVRFPELIERVHPTQLYEMVFLLALYFFLTRRRSQTHFTGEISVLYFALYSVWRFAIEFLRADNPVWICFTRNQWISLAIFGISGIVYVFLRPRKIG